MTNKKIQENCKHKFQAMTSSFGIDHGIYLARCVKCCKKIDNSKLYNKKEQKNK